MSTTGEVDLRSGASFELHHGAVEARGTEVVVTTVSGESVRRRIPSLARSDYAQFWSDGHRFVMVGLRSSDVLLVDPEGPVFAVIGDLLRLDLSDTYDPGGLERVSFVHVDDQRVAILYEIGAALLDLRSASVLWQRVHDDVQAVFATIRDDLLVFHTEHADLEISITDGSIHAQ